MEKVPISKFKANCLAMLEKALRTGKPIILTRLGIPVAEIVATKPQPPQKIKLGTMRGKLVIKGDIVSPVCPPEMWEVLRDEDPVGYSHLALESGRPRAGRRKSKGGRGKPG